MDPFAPTKDDRFSFGLWTVGNPGRDPFGAEVRPVQKPTHLVKKLAECGAWGVNLHDNDLVPFGASAKERDRIVADFKAALEDSGMVVPMATTNLFGHPVFKDGAFTANDPEVRAFALKKTMDAIDLGVELGAKIYVFWGGREGTEADACRDPRTAIARMRDALDYLCEYVKDQRYELVFALEAKPNEPRGDMYFPTTGHMLHFISTLAHEEMVGVNPEVAHENMSGLSFVHAVAQAMECGKLFHVDLNAQKIGRYDQDLRFGSEDVKQAFLLVRLLEATLGGDRYEGPRHFDSHAYRTEDEEGVWEFARGSMRTYKILAARARAFDADPEVRGLLAGTGDGAVAELARGYTRDKAARLRRLPVDPAALGARGLRYEQLDQLMMEHLLGVRS
ncbi:MAG TPA: xylose isomerase [Planctomycetota bacterium]|jgi:xylose isomerase|nr:xylose isomerase [Planctomycetota bacterium]